MATTLQPPPTTKFPSRGGVRPVREHGPEVSKTGMWAAMAAITMTFAAFTSAMVVREGSANDWRHFTFPPVLYFNTLVLLTSSFTLQISRRRLAAVALGAPQNTKHALPTLYLTLVLGGI